MSGRNLRVKYPFEGLPQERLAECLDLQYKWNSMHILQDAKVRLASDCPATLSPESRPSRGRLARLPKCEFKTLPMIVSKMAPYGSNFRRRTTVTVTCQFCYGQVASGTVVEE
jgi:hypothetical protein